VNETAHLSGVSQACDRVGTERALKRGVNAKGYLNLALLVAVMCGAYALMAHNYGWELHTNMVKQALWYLS